MLFEFTEEQLEFRQVLSRFFVEKSPSSEVRALMATDDGYDPHVWQQMCRELGLQALIIPEQFGGMGGSIIDLIVVFEEMGKVLLCAPYFSTVGLATNILLHCDDDMAKAQYLPKIASGETRATAAIPAGYPKKFASQPASIRASRSSGQYLLTGSEPLVLDAHTADLIIVIADTSNGQTFFAVAKNSPGVSTRLLPTADETRKFARLDLADAYGQIIGEEGTANEVLGPVLNWAYVCLALEQTGGAQKCLDMAVEYAKERIQFGRTIGSFQAIKHMCADTLLEVESAKSAARYAAWAIADANSDVFTAASLAKAYCSEAYTMAAANNIQIHGGIGYTWEVDCHLYYKRAKSSEALFGMPRHHRAAVAEYLGI